jgi:hypothetical protein
MADRIMAQCIGIPLVVCERYIAPRRQVTPSVLTWKWVSNDIFNISKGSGGRSLVRRHCPYEETVRTGSSFGPASWAACGHHSAAAEQCHTGSGG